MKSQVVMVILALLELALTLFFVAGILTGRVDDVFLGAILGSEFLVCLPLKLWRIGMRACYGEPETL
jgi:hypothetical protein